MLRFDHLAVSCTTLDDGVAAVEAALGIVLSPGGQHPYMATHNRLLNLGDLYLEVIAPDPSLPAPAWPRWFDLDAFTGTPRLTNWVAACDDLGMELALSPPGIGTPVTLQRGDFHWDMAVPADGRLPHDGAFPALIQWHGTVHPASRLPDAGVRLTRLDITHPAADTLQALLAPRMHDPRITFVAGPAKAMQATFTTPHGPRRLS
jgi:Glyoxalase-like domain